MEFCQRTLIANSTTVSDDQGYFAGLTGTTAGVGNYPVNTYELITNPESAYNLAGNQTDKVFSQVLPLCGIDYTTGNSTNQQIGQKHKGNSNSATIASDATVYNQRQYCARNLVIKDGVGKDTDKGKNTPGGTLDINPLNASSAAWSVRLKDQCYVGFKETNVTGSEVWVGGVPGTPIPVPYGINGFTFTGTSTPAAATAACSFFGASSAGTPPLTTCPPTAPLVALDNVTCVDRGACIFHSTIDNTCLVDRQAGSLFGKDTYDSAYITSVSGSGTSYVIDGASFNKNGDNTTRGIFRTFLGSRLGRSHTVAGTTTITLERDGNMWSRACPTLTSSRLGYYAVNDPYLTNKKWKDNLVTLAVGFQPVAGDNIPPPICGGQRYIGSESIDAIAFDDAFACLQGELSVYHPLTASTNDGNNWDRPIYCVQDPGIWTGPAVVAAACYLAGTGLGELECTGLISMMAPTSITPTGSSWQSDNTCLITHSTITSANPTVCTNITTATVPLATSVIASPLAAVPGTNPLGITHTGLSGTWAYNSGSSGPGTCTIVAEVTSGGGTSGTANLFGQDGTGSGNTITTRTNPCTSVTVAKQGSGLEFAITGTYAAGGSTNSGSCVIEATAGFSLESVCGSLEYVKSSVTSGQTTLTGLTAEWR
jgi:hypothetical protein